MYEYGLLPRARQDGLLEEVVGEELLLYDQKSHTAHCLSPAAACVWRHCDGEHDMTGLAELARVSEDLVVDALHELGEKDLLVAEPVLMQDTVPGESRREAIVRVGRVGAGAAAASLIVSATAATPAVASSIIWTCESKPKSTCCLCRNDCVGTFSFTPEGEKECVIHCEQGNNGGWLKFSNEAACNP